MNAYLPGGAGLPEMATIPDSGTKGVRFYREPAQPRALQITFLEAAGEAAWVENIRTLLATGRTAEADALLANELADFDGALALLSKATSGDDVLISGWDDLLPILAEWEGPPITAITLGLTNPPDLVFENGTAYEPDLLLGLYSDDSYPFSDSTKADLLAECGKDLPGWVDGEEDVEFHLTFSGLAQLNSALINCKHRYFLRDGRDGVEGRAPGGYVEFVLASWLLATRFLQAAERAVSGGCLPAGCQLITGTIGVGADFVAVLGPERPARAARRAGPAQPSFATLSMKPWVPREDPTAEPPPAQTLRERMRAEEPVVVAEPKPGLLARLFGRLRRG